MGALSDNRNSKELKGVDPVVAFTVIASDICYAGGMAAVDSTGEIQPASDTLGLQVQGKFPVKIDNTADGKTSEVIRGIFHYDNSSSAPLTRAAIGKPCYVADDQTVAATSTKLVTAGIVHDVDSDGVWVDQTPAALAQARAMARPLVVAKAVDATLTAAEVFQGNVVITSTKTGTLTLTLPTAVAGYRFGIQRISATAADDVVVTAASGDTVRGSAAAGTITNDTDAVSDVLWLETENATNWADALPLAKDRAEWAASS